MRLKFMGSADTPLAEPETQITVKAEKGGIGENFLVYVAGDLLIAIRGGHFPTVVVNETAAKKAGFEIACQ